MQNLGSAYLSPQNKSLAQSFRYMRNKPTIIAFKTPSMEENELENKNKTETNYTLLQAEEGQIAKGKNKNFITKNNLYFLNPNFLR